MHLYNVIKKFHWAHGLPFGPIVIRILYFIFSGSPKLDFQSWKKNTVREETRLKKEKMKYKTRRKVNSGKEGKEITRLAPLASLVN